MAGVFRSNFQALANAVWSLVAVASRSVNTTHVAGTAQTARDLGAQLDATVSSRAAASTALSTAQWTNTRAENLDNLDATVTSRAAASTALSTAQWTNGRAAALDNLDAAISSRQADAGLTSTHAGRIDAAISTRSSHSAADVWSVGARSLTDKAGFSLTQGSYEVTEFCQRGTVANAGGTNAGTAGISTVTLTKALMTHVGSSDNNNGNATARLSLGSTAVSVVTPSSSVTTTSGFEVADYAG